MIDCDPRCDSAAILSCPQFLYCNSAFEPSPDQSLSDLYKVRAQEVSQKAFIAVAVVAAHVP